MSARPDSAIEPVAPAWLRRLPRAPAGGPSRPLPVVQGLLVVHCLIGVVLVLYAGSVAVRGGHHYVPWLDQWLVLMIELGASVLCLVRVASVPGPRWPAQPMALGLLLWSLGDLVWRLEMRSGHVPTPSVADALFLSFYPPVYVSVVAIVRRGSPRAVVGAWLDGLLAALGTASLCAAFGFSRIMQVTGGSQAEILVNLAYPTGDLVLMTLSVGALTVMAQCDRQACLLLIGGLLFSFSDVQYLFQSAAGTYVQGSWVDVGWPTAIVILSLAAQPSRAAGRVRRSPSYRRRAVFPLVAYLVGVGVLAFDGHRPGDLLAECLGAGTLLVALARIVVLLREKRALELDRALEEGAAERERAVADMLHASMTHLAATLDPAEVLLRLRESLAEVVGGDSWLAVLDEGRLVRADGTPGTAAEARSAPDGWPGDPRLMGWLEARQPVAGGPASGVGRSSQQVASWLAVPLHSRDTCVGMVLLTSNAARAYGDAEIKIAKTLTFHGMVAYENARLFAEVEALAITDGLTGLHNRRHFFTLARRELALARRHGISLATAMVDIDHFKGVNDTYGHAVGDQVIQTVTRRIEEALRTTDLVGRYGGEEFSLMLPGGAEGAAIIAERIRTAVGDHDIDTDAGPLRVTVSLGVAKVDPDDPDADLAALLARADRALYQAKRSGRNRVVISESASRPLPPAAAHAGAPTVR